MSFNNDNIFIEKLLFIKLQFWRRYNSGFFSKFINDNACELKQNTNLDIKVLLSKENNSMFYSKLYYKYTSHLLKLIDSDNRDKKNKKSVKYFFIMHYKKNIFVV